MADNISFMESILSQKDLPDAIKDEIRGLLAIMHKDAPKECIRWICNLAKKERIFKKQVVGSALGDMSERWQRDLFDTLVNHPPFRFPNGVAENDAMRVLACAIWREEHFVEHFTLSDCQKVLDNLSTMLNQIRPLRAKDRDNEKLVRRWSRSIAELLELLLGMLRTRDSSDEEIRMLLQPNQKRTKEFAKQIESIEIMVAESGKDLFSRVQLNLPSKPEGDNTPDLLYALRLYLTGDDGANAIQITRVSDDEEE